MTPHNKEEIRFKLWIDTYLCILPVRGEIVALDRANNAVKEFDAKFGEFPIKVEESPKPELISSGKDGYNWNRQERRLYLPKSNKLMVERLLSLLPINQTPQNQDSEALVMNKDGLVTIWQPVWDNGKILFTIIYVQEQ